MRIPIRQISFPPVEVWTTFGHRNQLVCPISDDQPERSRLHNIPYAQQEEKHWIWVSNHLSRKNMPPKMHDPWTEFANVSRSLFVWWHHYTERELRPSKTSNGNGGSLRSEHRRTPKATSAFRGRRGSTSEFRSDTRSLARFLHLIMRRCSTRRDYRALE